MLVGQIRNLTAARSTLQEALLYQERLIDILNGAGIFTQCSSNCADAHRTALELVNDGGQYRRFCGCAGCV